MCWIATMWGLLQRPWTYAGLYVFLIPTFAFLYQARANEFFHSTIRLERGLVEEQEDVLDRLREAIIDDYRDAHDSTRIEVRADFLTLPNTAWRSDIRRVGLFDLDLSEHQDLSEASVSFQLTLPASGETSDIRAQAVHTVQSVPLSLPLQSPVVAYLRSGVAHYKPVSAERNAVATPFSVEQIFPQGYGNRVHEEGDPILRIDTTLQQDLEELWRAQHGLASGIAGGFERFFYLSAVTITTLGYGDIVPITTGTRLLVALESVLGIVIIGAFLATLYGSRWPRRRERTRARTTHP